MATPALTPNNYFSTTLSSSITTTDTTIFLASLPSGNEGYLEVGEGLATKEIIYYTSKGANFVTLPSVGAGRGVGGTSASAHSSGEIVKQKLNVEWWKALQDGTAMSTTAYTPVKTTNPVKFDVHPSVDVSVSSSVLTKVQLDTENFDTGNNFDSVTNYRFTAPIAGFYQISAQVGLSISGYTAVTAYAQITKNGSIYLTSTGLAGSGSTTTINRPVFSKLIQLAAGDYLELWGFIGEAGRQINGPNTYMSGFLVSTT